MPTGHTLPLGPSFGLREPLRGCPRPRFAALTRRKKASIAHFDGGARNVARIKESELSPTFVRAPVLTFFRRQNGRAFFPSLPIAARLPRSWRGDILNPCRGDALAWLVFFRKAKGQREIKSTLTFTASRRACRPTAVFPIQLAQSHTRPASREACRRAAVNLRSSCFPPSALRA